MIPFPTTTCLWFSVGCLVVGLAGCGNERPQISVGVRVRPAPSADDLPPLVSETALQQVPRRYHRHWAVVIGINAYDPATSGYPPLQTAVSDAQAFARVLADEFGFSGEHGGVLLLTDDADDPTRQPTKANIERALGEWLPSQATDPNDCALVFFAGHGEPDDPGYLAGRDTHRKALPETAISLKELCQTLHEKLTCRHKGIILTSCYSGRLFDSPPPGTVAPVTPTAANPPTDNALSLYLSRPAMIGLSAGREKPVRDRDGPRDPHSPFMQVLLREMEDRCDSSGSDGVFRLSSLGERIQQQLEEGPRDLSRFETAQPSRVGPVAPYHAGGEFLFFPTLSRATPTERTRRTDHAVQLARVRRMLVADFLLAQEVLFDRNVFPDAQRDTAWQCLAGQFQGLRSVVTRHPGPIQWMQLVQHGALLLSLDVAGQLRFTAVPEGRSTAHDLAPVGETAVAWCAALSPDERQLFVGMFAGTLNVYDLDLDQRTVVLRSTLPLEGRPSAMGARAGRLVVTTDQGRCQLFDAQTLEAFPPVPIAAGGLFAVGLSADGTHLATGGTDGVVRVGKIDGQQVHFEREWVHRGTVTALCFLETERLMIAALSGTNHLQVWDVPTGLVVHSQAETKTLWPLSRSACASAALDNAVFELDLSRPERVQEIAPPTPTIPVAAVASPATDTLWLAQNDGAILRTVRSARHTVTPQFRRSPAPAIVDFSLPADEVVMACTDQTFRRLSTTTFQEIGFPIKLPGEVQQLCLSPSGRQCGMAFLDGMVGVMSLYAATLETRRRLFPTEVEVTAIHFTPDGESLLAGSSTGTVVAWTPATDMLEPLGTLESAITALSASPSFPGLVIGTETQGLALVERTRMWRWQKTPVDTAPVWSLALAPQSSRVAVLGTSRRGAVYSYPTWQKLVELPSATPAVWSAAFSPDERTLITGGDDGWLRLYDASTGIGLLEFPAHSGRVDRIAFSADTKILCTKDDRGELALWKLGSVTIDTSPPAAGRSRDRSDR